METFEKLQTERLILRPFLPCDLEDLSSCLSDPETVRFEPYPAMTPPEVEAALNQRIHSREMTAVQRKADGKMIGSVYLGERDFDALELGFVFNRRFWRRGYAFESCQALVRRAFARGIHRIYAECDPQNAASWRLLERLGFQQEAHLRKNLYFWKDETGAPQWKDTYVYGRLWEDLKDENSVPAAEQP